MTRKDTRSPAFGLGLVRGRMRIAL